MGTREFHSSPLSHSLAHVFLFRLLTAVSRGTWVNIFPLPLYICGDVLDLDIVNCSSRTCLPDPPSGSASYKEDDLRDAHFLKFMGYRALHPSHKSNGVARKQITSASGYFLEQASFLNSLSSSPPF